MATRKINPTSPGQRGMTRPDYAEITTSTPEKSTGKQVFTRFNALCKSVPAFPVALLLNAFYILLSQIVASSFSSHSDFFFSISFLILCAIACAALPA